MKKTQDPERARSLPYTIALFDLDGTLVESGPGIFAAARAVLRELSLPDLPDCEMVKMVGPPLADSFQNILKVPSELIPEAVRLYHTISATVGMDLIKPYPGIESLLGELKTAGITLGVVTSKITPTAKAHLTRFGLAPYFDYIGGGTPGGSAEKLPILMAALEALGAEKARAVMVGDRHFDLLAAKKAGVASIGVTYGYGSAQEIASCQPTHTAADVEELRNLLIGEPSTGKEK